jgi:folate-dependent phosphoribosylglycinamide formyltransferase PurN
MHVGVVSSSEGQTFEQLCRGVEHLDVSFSVVTDRPCGIEQVAHARGLPCRRIEGDREAFSRRAAQELTRQSADFVLLYFNRLVSPALHAVLPTFNIHPSLLPAFAGFGALDAARERAVRFVGATLHLATEQPDGGPIVAQVCAPVRPPCSAAQLGELSFVQRVYLSLVAVELASDGALDVSLADGTARHRGARPYSDRCNPALQDAGMLAVVHGLEAERKLRVTR